MADEKARVPERSGSGVDETVATAEETPAPEETAVAAADRPPVTDKIVFGVAAALVILLVSIFFVSGADAASIVMGTLVLRENDRRSGPGVLRRERAG